MQNLESSTQAKSNHLRLHKRCAAFVASTCLSVLGASTCLAQSAVTDSPLQWSIGAGAHMQNQSNADWHGGEVGLYMRKPSAPGLNIPTFEADILAGVANYSNDNLGDLDSSGLFETRWRALWSKSMGSGVLGYGLSLQTYYNDLNGTTNLGQMGYERTSVQLWLPVRWTMNGVSLHTNAPSTPLIWDAGALVWGRHYSKLSQNNSSLEDVTNRQNWGLYLQLSKDFPAESGSWRPYARWTWLDKTDNSRGFREPETHRVQVGVSWSPTR